MQIYQNIAQLKLAEEQDGWSFQKMKKKCKRFLLLLIKIAIRRLFWGMGATLFLTWIFLMVLWFQLDILTGLRIWEIARLRLEQVLIYLLLTIDLKI